MTKSEQYDMYKKENPDFIYMLSPMDERYNLMVGYLKNLFIETPITH